jgi:hypothetical protein
MADLTALNAAVAADGDLTRSVLAMLAGLKANVAELEAQLAAAIAAQVEQAVIDGITAQIEANNAALAAVTAVVENTAVEPEVIVEPEV